MGLALFIGLGGLDGSAVIRPGVIPPQHARWTKLSGVTSNMLEGVTSREARFRNRLRHYEPLDSILRRVVSP